jgi:response regulator RpfG family c-di-GMP phosphodiesterase
MTKNQSSPAANKSRYSILIVDDDHLILKALARQLRDHEVYLACDINLALKVIQRDPIDLVITDYNMPGGDGVALLDLIRRLFPAIRRVLMSTAPPQSLKDLQRIGLVEYFLAKPFHLPLAAVVASVIEGKAAAQMTSRMKKRHDRGAVACDG